MLKEYVRRIQELEGALQQTQSSKSVSTSSCKTLSSISLHNLGDNDIGGAGIAGENVLPSSKFSPARSR